MSGHVFFSQKHRTESADTEEPNQPELTIELASYELLPHPSTGGAWSCPSAGAVPWWGGCTLR
jgi:hypothetical protein